MAQQPREKAYCRRCGRVLDIPEAFTLCPLCRLLPSEQYPLPLVQVNATPPCCLMSEEIVLGGLLLSRWKLRKVCLQPFDFYTPLHRAVYEGILAIKPNPDWNPLAVGGWLYGCYDGEPTRWPWALYLIHLMCWAEDKPDSELIARAGRIRELAARRQRIAAALTEIRKAYSYE